MNALLPPPQFAGSFGSAASHLQASRRRREAFPQRALAGRREQDPQGRPGRPHSPRQVRKLTAGTHLLTRTHWSSAWLLRLSICIALVGCEVADQPLEPLPATASLREADFNATTGGLPGEPVFELALTIDGQPISGRMVTATATVTAVVSTDLARLTILVPEMEVLAASGADGDFRIPVRTPLPVRDSWSGPMEAGQTVTRTVDVTVPAEGFFRVVAYVSEVSPDSRRLLRGHIPQSAAEEELWLFAGEASGQVREEFDASAVPAGYLPLPGPLRSISAPGKVLDGSSARMVTGSVLWEILYFDSQVAQFLPIMFADWSVEYRQGLFGPLTGTAQGSTDLNGLVSLPCRPGEHYSGVTDTSGFSVRTSPLSTAGWGGTFDVDCGLVRQAVLTNNSARVYAVMSRAAYDAQVFFGLSRPLVVAEISSSIPNSYYSLSLDRVYIRANSLPGEYGRFVIAHEYGHAFHNVAMGGINPDFSVNCNPHSISAPSSYGCALSEGFANFFSVFLTGSFLASFEAGYHTPGVPNPTTEGAVAATFLDLVDPENEPHDAAQWSYLPQLVGSCQTRTILGAWVRASGIDQITYCLEQDIDPFVAPLHPQRVPPTSWQHSASTPGTWSKAKARSVWYHNIFR